MKRSLYTLLALLTLLVLGGAWFSASYDRVAERELVPPRLEAWRDATLAMRRLLAQLGYEVRSISTLEGEPQLPADGALFLPARRGAVTPPALARLTDFVERGGLLVMESESDAAPDPVFDAFGIQRAHLRYPEAMPNTAFAWFQWSERTEPLDSDVAGVMQLAGPGDPTPLVVSLGGGETLSSERPVEWRMESRDGVHGLVLRHGQGRVVAVNDSGFYLNWMIGRSDNAEFLSRILQLQPDRHSVVVLSRRTPGLGAWLWQHARPVVAVLGVLILCSLWRAIPRFGPMLPDPEPVRRRLGDHLVASGRYLWRIGQRRSLAASASRMARAMLFRREPQFTLTPAAQRAAWLVARHGIPLSAAEAVLGERGVDGEAQLLALARACRRIHAGATETAATTSVPSSTVSDSPHA